jgi:hypothetical protein
MSHQTVEGDRWHQQTKGHSGASSVIPRKRIPTEDSGDQGVAAAHGTDHRDVRRLSTTLHGHGSHDVEGGTRVI